jgi:tRNA pseudouridine55 synthase
VVDFVRRVTGERTVGHAGTLDPFATGLLIVGVGREATREFPKLVGLDKRYRATIHLGATSDTDDRTGRITPNSSLRDKLTSLHNKATFPSLGDDDTPLPPNSSLRDAEAVLKKFTGIIQQIPPMYSAKKINGKKMYELARAGKEFERVPVEVEIFELKWLETHNSRLITLAVHCSSGTYIRALARDIGEALGSGAYLEELERTAIGPFQLEDATALADLNKENWPEKLQSITSIIEACRT